MSEIPSDVSPSLLESPTAHSAVLVGLCPRGAGVQLRSGWSFGRRFLARNHSSVQKRLPRVQV